MKKMKDFLEKISSGKGLYITAAMSIVLAVAALAYMYNSSVKMIGELDLPRVTVTEEAPARQNVTGESDPRYTAEQTTQEPTETTAVTTTKATTTSATAPVVTTSPTTQPPTTETFSNTSFIFPTSGAVLKDYSPTAVYDETMEDYRPHKGIDFICEEGSEVVSVGEGEVTKVTSDTGYGYCVEVSYGSFTARYCGLEQGTTVVIGDRVKKGDIIGHLGAIPIEGKQTSHLHFETYSGGEAIDPMRALKKN